MMNLRKLSIILFLLGFIIICIVSNTNVFAEKERVDITFSDSNLYKAIKQELDLQGISYQDSSDTQTIRVLETDIANITSLELNALKITNLSGIENFTALEELSLRSNLVTSISELNQLVNLRKLDVSHNRLNNLNGINALVNLTELNVYDNYINDFDGLEGMTSLNVLIAGDNNEKQTYTSEQMKLTAIGTLTNLKELDFSRNNVPTILQEFVKLRKLEKANLRGCRIDDNTLDSVYSELQYMRYLKKLNLYDNNIASITPLFDVVFLEEINVGKNSISSLEGILNNNECVWEYLKKLDISGNNIRNSSTELEYLRSRNNSTDEEERIELNYEDITDTSNLPHTDANGVKYVTYDDFGARCDGVYDDFIAIRNAHTFANRNKCEVRAIPGEEKEYHIFKYDEDYVEVLTNVDWQGAIIRIHDENIFDLAGRDKNIFYIKTNNGRSKSFDNPNITLNTSTKKIEGIDSFLTELNAYGFSKYFCYAENSNVKQHIRFQGVDSISEGTNQLDCFRIDSEGNLLNDIQWDFETITKLAIFPISETKLTIKNGKFISNAYDVESEITSRNNKSTHIMRAMLFRGACNVDISNIEHRVSRDTVCGSYYGFLTFKYCSEVNIKDCYLSARERRIRNNYELVMDECSDFYCYNIDSNDLENITKWGINKSDKCKDFLYENCRLNRIDAHEGIYNLTVKNCTLGCRHLTQTGKGVLNIINCVIESEKLLTLRGDYGSTWTGRVNIIDCTHRYAGEYGYGLLDFTISVRNDGTLHYFGYDVHMPEIYVENLTIDCINKQDLRYYLLIPNWYPEKNALLPDDYWPSTIQINGFKFINYSGSEPYIKLLDKEVESINEENNTIILTNTTLKQVEGIDLTHEFNINEKVVSDKDIKLEITENNSAFNTITLYKNGVEILEETIIETKFEHLFNEEGLYKIVLYSQGTIDNFEKKGTKEYEFEINRNPSHTHTMIKTPAKSATCEEEGNLEYYYCSSCHKYFSDSNGYVETTQSATVINALGHDWGEWQIEKEATSTENGLRARTCKRNSAHRETAIIEKTSYTVLEGKNSQYKWDNKDLTFKIDGEYTKFSKVKVDDAVLDQSNYTSKSGSTIVTLKSSYLKTLSEGNHVIEFVFTDGLVSTTFSIGQKPQEPVNNTVNNNTVNNVVNNTVNNSVTNNTVKNTVNNTTSNNTVKNNTSNNTSQQQQQTTSGEADEEVTIINNRYIKSSGTGTTYVTTESTSSGATTSSTSNSSKLSNIKTGDYIIIAIALPVIIIIVNIVISKMKKGKKKQDKKDED